MIPRSRYRQALRPVLFATVALAACSPEAAQGPPYTPVADVAQLMTQVVEPAAETYWDAVGWILDQEGEHEIYPRSPEEWAVVQHAAWTVTESGNLLMMRPEMRSDAAWMGFANSMIEAGKKAIKAAEAEDRDAVFDTGAELYFTCTACHTAYALETLPPSEVADSIAGMAGDREEGLR